MASDSHIHITSCTLSRLYLQYAGCAFKLGQNVGSPDLLQPHSPCGPSIEPFWNPSLVDMGFEHKKHKLQGNVLYSGPTGQRGAMTFLSFAKGHKLS